MHGPGYRLQLVRKRYSSQGLELSSRFRDIPALRFLRKDDKKIRWLPVKSLSGLGALRLRGKARSAPITVATKSSNVVISYKPTSPDLMMAIIVVLLC